MGATNDDDGVSGGAGRERRLVLKEGEERGQKRVRGNEEPEKVFNPGDQSNILSPQSPSLIIGSFPFLPRGAMN